MVNLKPEPEVLPREILYDLGKLIEPQDYRALYYFLTLCGPRVTEALKVEHSDFRWDYFPKVDKNVLLVTLQTEKRADHLNRVIPTMVFTDETETNLFKEVFSWWESCSEGRVFQLDRSIAWRKFKKYITLEDVTSRLGRPLKEVLNAQEKEAPLLRFYPHYLRHCRATHLSKGPYCQRDDLIQAYFGWYGREMVVRYTHTMVEELVR